MQGFAYHRQSWSLPLYFSLFIIVIISLTSCGSRHKQDGPPSYYVDETLIPDAIPKPEPLAKYGNRPTYYVFGKPYHVMPSARGYFAVGTASWYGTKFNTRKTSSGERYNMLAMTAAHKTLPLPTYVEVTNLSNHRQVIVKVNDRGPFSGSRLIDLSYVAAKKLGMLGHGTTTVSIRAIDPTRYDQPMQLVKQVPDAAVTSIRAITPPHHIAQRYANPPHPSKPRRALATPHHANAKPIRTYQSQPAPAASAQSLKQRQYMVTRHAYSTNLIYLQVGAFRNKENALHLQSKLADLLSVPVSITYNWGKRLYRVQVGPFSNDRQVNKMLKLLRQKGFTPAKVNL